MSQTVEIDFGDRAPNIFVLDDERMIRWSLRSCFEEAGAVVEEAANLAEARAQLQSHKPDLAVLDLKLPDGSGLEILKEIIAQDPELPVLIITAYGSLAGAVEAMKLGAFDYVSKPFDLDDLLFTARRALEHSDLRKNAEAQSRLNPGDWPVAVDPNTKALVTLLERVGQTNAGTVLLLGDSGVGKGLAARYLHQCGGDDSRPFIPVSCTSIPETLLESELFGHEKGAFTDAKETKRGLAELAAGGTLFLDEIGDLPAGIQAKLLTLLEDREFRRVGGNQQIKLEARIIAATNRDLAEAVTEGSFREDLYYRLKVVPIEIPNLQQRRADVIPLAEFFLNHFRQELGSKASKFSPDATKLLKSYRWPGNVRELRNSIERAALLSAGETIGVEDLPSDLIGARMPFTESGGLPQLPDGGVDLEKLERAWVAEALSRCEGNRSRAAELLGMKRDQIRYRIDKYGLGD